MSVTWLFYAALFVFPIVVYIVVRNPDIIWDTLRWFEHGRDDRHGKFGRSTYIALAWLFGGGVLTLLAYLRFGRTIQELWGFWQ